MDKLREVAQSILNRINKAIDEPNNTMSDGKALREMLRQLKLARDEITALREALAEQAEQRSDSERMEPVEIGSVLQKVMSRLTELLDEDQFNNINSIVETSGYAAPVCTKDLTDYEIEKAIGLLNGYDAFRAVIAADREKNK